MSSFVGRVMSTSLALFVAAGWRRPGRLCPDQSRHEQPERRRGTADRPQPDQPMGNGVFIG